MEVRENSSEPSGPLPIRRLQESVINRIAAGEIIHRPAAALKELIENSLDAESTSIKITVKDGGVKLLQIQDNGCGIRKTDLPILAERFTTSKISTFSDLSKLTTYGFRGEALASMSFVAHLSVVTKTKEDTCAWRACYADGHLVPAKEGSTVDPKPCAGNDGTTITIENLFYNTPTRLGALRGASEEYARILDVVQKYAIHNPHVAFSCKKAGSASPDVSTPSGSDTKTAIRMIYGQTIVKDLLRSKILPTDSEADSEAGENDDSPLWSAEAFFTNANYQAKKTVLLLFINHRLVESSRIKKALEGIYVGVLPKGTSPFMYLSLQIDPQSIDVNVHPTKREVRFLNEDEIIERLANIMQGTLLNQSQSRVYEYQTLLTGGILEKQTDLKGKGKAKEVTFDEPEGGERSGSSSAAATPHATAKKTPSNHKVRTSQKDRTLESMFPVLNPSQVKTRNVIDVDEEDEAPPTPKTTSEIKESLCNLTSVLALRKAIGKLRHHQLTEILENHIFVGIVDLGRCLSLIQHAKNLYLVNHGALAEELFYQLGLRQFGNFSRIRLEPPPSLHKLVSLAVDVEEGVKKDNLDSGQITDKIVRILTERREMLSEYFSLTINSQGLVESIPLILKNYTPNLDKLPLFLMRLGPQVNWNSEQECFESFLRELAYFYVPEPLIPDKVVGSESKDEEEATRWQIQHALFPALSRYIVAPKSLLNRDVVQVANLPDLYRVFERC